MLICIDAGHGLLTAGKRCLKSIDPNETREWMLNRRIADKLQNLLEDYGYLWPTRRGRMFISPFTIMRV